MLSRFKNLVRPTGRLIGKCELGNGLQNEKFSIGTRCDFCGESQARNFHTSTPRKKESRELEYRKAALHDEKREFRVEDIYKGDLAKKRKEQYFPTIDLPNTKFDGIAFKDLPVVHIKATANNTLFSLTERGIVKLVRTCGMEGFKNARKGTNVAAQTAGLSLGARAIKRGYKTVRVLIGGLGPGRTSSIKGLSLSGVNIVSITDRTVDFTSLRARKQKRL